jgi:hypothetical protein
MEDDDRQCGICGVVKHRSQFDKRHGRVCRKCLSDRMKFKRSGSIKMSLNHKLTKAKGRKKFSVDINVEYLLELWDFQKGLCAVTKIPMITTDTDSDLGVSIDRLDNDKGYIVGNVRLTCARVNLMRNTLSDSMLYWWASAISTGIYED